MPGELLQMTRSKELKAELKKRDAALERICDELCDAAAFGRTPEPNTILAAVRSAYDQGPSKE
jgi:hypothetical protein